MLIRSTVFEPEEETPFLTWQTITFFNFLEKMIDDEKAEGQMAPSVDSYLLAAALFSQYFGVLIMFYRDPSIYVYFGVLVGCAVLFALAADLLLVPALLALIYGKHLAAVSDKHLFESPV